MKQDIRPNETEYPVKGNRISGQVKQNIGLDKTEYPENETGYLAR